MKESLLNTFRKVTEENRKQAIILGRVLYVIERKGSLITYRGSFSIDPCFEKGYYWYPCRPWQKNKESHYKVFMNEGINRSEWIAINKRLIDMYISQECLYLNPSDPILTFKKEN